MNASQHADSRRFGPFAAGLSCSGNFVLISKSIGDVRNSSVSFSVGKLVAGSAFLEAETKFLSGQAKTT